MAIFSKATTLVVAISKHSARLSCRALKTRETRTPYSKSKLKQKKKGKQ
jgi:hypothetical protein